MATRLQDLTKIISDSDKLIDVALLHAQQENVNFIRQHASSVTADDAGTAPAAIGILLQAIRKENYPNDSTVEFAPGFDSNRNNANNVEVFEAMMKNLEGPFPKTIYVPIGVPRHMTALAIKIDKDGKPSEALFFNSMGGGKNSSYYTHNTKGVKPFLDVLRNAPFNVREQSIYTTDRQFQSEPGDKYCGHWAAWFCEKCAENSNLSFSKLKDKFEQQQKPQINSIRKGNKEKFLAYLKHCTDNVPQSRPGTISIDTTNPAVKEANKINDIILSFRENSRGQYEPVFSEGATPAKKAAAYGTALRILQKKGLDYSNVVLGESDKKKLLSAGIDLSQLQPLPLSRVHPKRITEETKVHAEVEQKISADSSVPKLATFSISQIKWKIGSRIPEIIDRDRNTIVSFPGISALDDIKKTHLPIKIKIAPGASDELIKKALEKFSDDIGIDMLHLSRRVELYIDDPNDRERIEKIASGVFVDREIKINFAIPELTPKQASKVKPTIVAGLAKRFSALGREEVKRYEEVKGKVEREMGKATPGALLTPGKVRFELIAQPLSPQSTPILEMRSGAGAPIDVLDVPHKHQTFIDFVKSISASLVQKNNEYTQGKIERIITDVNKGTVILIDKKAKVDNPKDREIKIEHHGTKSTFSGTNSDVVMLSALRAASAILNTNASNNVVVPVGLTGDMNKIVRMRRLAKQNDINIKVQSVDLNTAILPKGHLGQDTVIEFAQKDHCQVRVSGNKFEEVIALLDTCYEKGVPTKLDTGTHDALAAQYPGGREALDKVLQKYETQPTPDRAAGPGRQA